MPRDRSKDPGEFDPENVPPFWLRDDGTGQIDPRVLKVANESWPWAFWLTKQELRDGAYALEIVEYIAVEVSKRLKADPGVDRNLKAYFKTAFTRRVRAVATRAARVKYEGRPQDLEANHQPEAADWTKLFEDRMAIGALLPYMTDSVRRILRYRLLDFSWKEISRELGVTEKQAKSRFYYGVHQAHERLCAAREKRARGEDAPQCE